MSKTWYEELSSALNLGRQWLGADQGSAGRGRARPGFGWFIPDNPQSVGSDPLILFADQLLLTSGDEELIETLLSLL